MEIKFEHWLTAGAFSFSRCIKKEPTASNLLVALSAKNSANPWKILLPNQLMNQMISS